MENTEKFIIEIEQADGTYLPLGIMHFRTILPQEFDIRDDADGYAFNLKKIDKKTRVVRATTTYEVMEE